MQNPCETLKILPKIVFNTDFSVHSILCIIEAFVFEQCITICVKTGSMSVKAGKFWDPEVGTDGYLWLSCCNKMKK